VTDDFLYAPLSFGIPVEGVDIGKSGEEASERVRLGPQHLERIQIADEIDVGGILEAGVFCRFRGGRQHGSTKSE
jgi:hypothetical protein